MVLITYDIVHFETTYVFALFQNNILSVYTLKIYSGVKVKIRRKASLFVQ